VVVLFVPVSVARHDQQLSNRKSQEKKMEETPEADQTNVRDVQPTNQQETDNGRPGIFFAQLVVLFPDTPQLFLKEESEKKLRMMLLHLICLLAIL
jgi:hypothetical protein